MKKYFITCLAAALFTLQACSNNAGDEQAAMNQKKIDVAVKSTAVFDSGNVNDLDSLIAEDAVDHQLDTSMTKKSGLAGVKEMFMMYHAAFPDMHTKIHSMAVAGDTVFAMSTTTGTQKGEFMGMPPTNKEMSFSGVDIMVIKDGKITEHWGYIDPADMMAMQNMMQSSQMDMKNKKMK